jgi:DNA-binding transcriptional LysR family regulator
MDTFVRIAINQNLVSTASELAVSPGLVTRRLQKLETDLGVSLITRSTRRLSLTQAGKRYFEFAKRILREVQQEEHEIRQVHDQPAGRINIMSPVSFGIMEMGKAVTDFMVQYPGIQVTLIIGDNGKDGVDPAEYGADIAIRFTQAKDTSLHMRKVGSMRWILCASPRYLRKAGVPKTPADLAEHSCLVTSKPFRNGAWQLSGRGGIEKIKVSGVVSPNTAITMRYMALDGAGIALLPEFCVAQDIRKRRLVALLKDYEVAEQPICAYYHDAQKQPLSMRLFIDFLEGRFKSYQWGHLPDGL